MNETMIDTSHVEDLRNRVSIEPSNFFHKITTTRTRNIGLEGFNREADWRRFFANFHDDCQRYAKFRLKGRPDLAEDATAIVMEKICANPLLIPRSPNIHFRAVIATLVRLTAIALYRAEKNPQRQKYAALTAPLQLDTTSQDYDRKRLCLLTINLIRNDLLREDYPNGRLSREIDSLDLRIWRARQQPGASDLNVARDLGLGYSKKAKDATERVDERIRKDAEALLASLGLL